MYLIIITIVAIVLAIPTVFVAVTVLCAYLLMTPDKPAYKDHAKALAAIPGWVFRIQTWLLSVAHAFLNLAPAPLRVAEVSVAFMTSQALFVMHNLGVPEALQSGPKTAAELAALVGPDTNPEWLARVLKYAAEHGLVKRTKRAGLQPPGMPKVSAPNGHPRFSFGYSCNDLYSANAVTACLCPKHPNYMGDLVKMFEDHFAGFTQLSEGIKSNTTPFELWSEGGVDFWTHLRRSPRHAATFDGAMRACNHTGGKMVVQQYNWGQYDLVVDVGGGSGHFVMELLRNYPRLKGVVVDQKEQIARGKEWWSDTSPDLLPRVQLVSGDMFNPDALPKPPKGFKVVFVLKQILHDWSDADSVAILKSIRTVMPEEAIAAGDVSLLVLETGSFETFDTSLFSHRLEADLTMLMAYGDGKERNEGQTQALLEAGGFNMRGIIPSNGLMAVIEAIPVPGKAGAVDGIRAGRRDQDKEE